jgi:hypothetical protein
MSRIVASYLVLQTTAQSVPAPPSWFGEVTLIASYLTRGEKLLGSCAWPVSQHLSRVCGFNKYALVQVQPEPTVRIHVAVH